MELFDLDISEPGGQEPDHILRLPDAEWGGPGLLGQPGGQLKGGQKPGRLGRPHASGLHQLGPRSRREPPERAFAHLQQPAGNVERRCAAGTGAEEDGQQFGRGE